MSNDKEKDLKNPCPRCKKHEAREPHVCPFKYEVNDSKAKCKCCYECKNNCAMEV